MDFTKLRLSGFKSFVEPTELLIESGITGVVGPNGCGKSNVVEALKWVMGETSAKKMRGGEMDDVIFGGTANRPSRNIAEVVLYLDNSKRTAPAPFNDSDEVEVSRRIERGMGSAYRINGREVRARDVQLLFADLATGAHSTAMVNQGRVGALIGAKPTERRVLLEEAAGITGLHSRRHEAELRLRAAEANLERLDDVIGALENQYQGLQRQARQAARYRRLSDHIRHHEAILLHLRWVDATAAIEAAAERLRAAETVVGERTAAAGTAATAQAEAAAALPGLRQREVEAAAELQRLHVARRELEAEETRLAEAQAAVAHRLEQIAADVERENQLAADAATALRRLEEEATDIARAREGEAEAKAAADAALAEVRRELDSREAELARLTEQVAATEARRAALSRQGEELAGRIERLRRREAEVAAERESLAAEVAADAALKEAEAAIGRSEAAVAAAQSEMDAAGVARGASETHEAEARTAAQEAESACARLAAEEKALAEMLEAGAGDLFPPLVDAVRVEPGYETALGAALGDDLVAPIDTAAPLHWATLPPLAESPALPEGAVPLERFVAGPAALARRIAQIGLVEDARTGAALRDRLKIGQRLVTRDGALFRWDGYTVGAGTPTAAAKRLAQRNRLAELRQTMPEAEARRVAANSVLEEARRATAAATERERTAREAIQSAFGVLNSAREQHARLANAAAAAHSRLAAITETAERLQADLAEAEEQSAAAAEALAAIGDPAADRERINALRAEIGERRAIEAERRGAYDRLLREAQERITRLNAIGDETRLWRERAAGAEQRLADLEQRRQAATDEQARHAARPAEIAEQRDRLLTMLEESEARRRQEADRLAEGETVQAEADKALRQAEARLGEAREERVRCQAQVEQARHDGDAVAERIAERLGCKPEAVLAEAGIAADQALPERMAVETKLERLVRERDNMGPVNLRAEAEVAELEQQIQGMQTEREDLVAAIAKLRQGIGALNREGRERLLAAFDRVNTHFQDLFVRLFGGGSAHLALTEADDPLQAGLEVMASPPGKKTQVMSLLSGGEQALTAIALLFAVFLTNPAPICVLDEVDAPLDDANVDRFCGLLEEIAHAGTTRFLVVTHHRITMARMDRLFGVTMGERGVSQLVSVDLHRAEALRKTA